MASRNRSDRSGFSLLELIIVLMVMISLLAIVWPNLQRPLRRNSLSEAAQSLRGAIDDSRYLAITSGSPVFVQLRSGSDEIRAGTFENFASAEGDAVSLMSSPLSQAQSKSAPSVSGGENQPLASTPQASIRTWRLPTAVVIANVRWTLEPEVFDFDKENSAGGLPAATESKLAVAEVQSSRDIAVGLDQAQSDWWLPLVATGRGRDATIELLDTSINERLTVTFASATGALEIER